MQDFKKLAIDIANKYKFEPYRASAKALSDGNGGSNLSRCENHLDSDFMKSLEALEFLDSKYLSK